jgi:hypothetical protein
MAPVLVNFSQGPQWINLIGILCFISPCSSLKDRITMLSLSDTKGERM